MKKTLLFLLFIFLGLGITFAQSLSGNVNSNVGKMENRLDYANVEIYQNNKLIASLITDRYGNYNVALDSGSYQVNVMYNGYRTFTKDIVVKGNENVEITLEEDPTVETLDEIAVKAPEEKRKPTKIESYYMFKSLEVEEEIVIDSHIESDDKTEKEKNPSISLHETKIESSFVYDYSPEDLYGEPIKPSKLKPKQKPYLKGITASEINDFSKWKLWEDLMDGELSRFQKDWQISPQERYVVQVMNAYKIPIVDADVQLIDEAGVTLWHAKTDNTGKAELWNSIIFEKTVEKVDEIIISFQGETKKIRRPKPFDKGINSVTLEASCEAFNAVDIAFVVDATGSMQDEIDFLKLEINDVVFQAKQMNDQLTMRFGSVFYRDQGDEYLTRKRDFTKVLSESSSFIKSQVADGGGDNPEAVDEGLRVAIDEMSWSADARARILFLILDAPPHNNRAVQDRITQLATEAAKKGIRIIPITASGLNKTAEYLMRSLALATNGTYMFISDDSGIGDGHLKPSTDDYEVKLLNDLLTSTIKNYIYVPGCNELIPDLPFEYPDSLVAYEIPLDTIDNDSAEQYIPPLETITWNFYPNPTYGELNIEVSKEVEMLYLTDMTGKILRQIPMNGATTTRINLDGLAMGIYFLRYPVGKQWLTGKVMLMR